MLPPSLCTLGILFVQGVRALAPRAVLGNNVAYKGTTVGKIEHFQNIRFAEARRFAPPELYTPEQDSILDASSPGPACPQIKDALPPFFSETREISEDCLNLRVARPAGTTKVSRLPVVVHIYGGGVIKGSAYDPHFEPDKLLSIAVANNKPIIYVAINYRVTIFGFARLPILKDQKSLNVGMRDQRAALQWIKDNIAAFGGDPGKITSFGSSSGGTFSSLHLMAYGGEQGVPFSQVWSMSGPPGTALNITSEATTLHTLAVAERLGCGNDLEEDEKLLECLRDTPMEKLLEVAMAYSVKNHPPLGLFTFIPSVDDDFIPGRTTTLYEAGRFAKGIPTVFGWTQDDGASNVGPGHLIQAEEDMVAPVKAFASGLTSEQMAELFSYYEEADFRYEVENYEARKEASEPIVSVHYFRLSRILRDILFTCSSINFGHAMAKHSQALDTDFSGVRLYVLNQSMLTPLWKGVGMPYISVSHGSGHNYIFGGHFLEGEVSPADQELSETFVKSFINFAYTGNPVTAEADGFGNWPAIRAESEASLKEVPVQLIGGPLGSGSCRVHADVQEHAMPTLDKHGEQHVMGEQVEYMGMKSKTEALRVQQLGREKLIRRCTFVNGLAEALGV
ncbi:alpha/beta-hydrolase [Pleomassaria siparia CBS 279.74]|uniref:Alpha/beta-hydrolase n=1 Tax=Pleomassaria siparia CBS 279.74 TaxID=1314801 RepID=A0A6G1K9V7_9PLEO|nr:alpha/beta-hydrolase [Pleomassaria siparia CBS 279.74]